MPSDGFFATEILQKSVLARALSSIPLGSLWHSPDTLVGWEGDIPSPFSTPSWRLWRLSHRRHRYSLHLRHSSTFLVPKNTDLMLTSVLLPPSDCPFLRYRPLYSSVVWVISCWALLYSQCCSQLWLSKLLASANSSFSSTFLSHSLCKLVIVIGATTLSPMRCVPNNFGEPGLHSGSQGKLL